MHKCTHKDTLMQTNTQTHGYINIYRHTDKHKNVPDLQFLWLAPSIPSTRYGYYETEELIQKYFIKKLKLQNYLLQTCSPGNLPSAVCISAMPGSISENKFVKALPANEFLSFWCPEWIKNIFLSVNILLQRKMSQGVRNRE